MGLWLFRGIDWRFTDFYFEAIRLPSLLILASHDTLLFILCFSPPCRLRLQHFFLQVSWRGIVIIENVVLHRALN